MRPVLVVWEDGRLLAGFGTNFQTCTPPYWLHSRFGEDLRIMPNSNCQQSAEPSRRTERTAEPLRESRHNRHTFATRIADEGIDLATLADILGHNSIRIVERYVHPTDEHKKSAMVRYESAQMIRAAAGQSERPNLSEENRVVILS
jgi:hypothetical protein